MVSLIEYAITWIGNGIVTAFLIVLNDRLFKSQIEKIVNKSLEKVKKSLGVSAELQKVNQNDQPV